MVKKLSRRLGRHYDAHVKPSGLNITQFAVLRVIARRAGEPLAHMAEELEMDRTSLYRAIQPMVRDGWIDSLEGEEANSRTARLSRKGKRLLQNAEGAWGKVQDTLVQRYGESAYDELLRSLHRLADCLEEAPVSAS